jgi:hypothetical protein
MVCCLAILFKHFKENNLLFSLKGSETDTARIQNSVFADRYVPEKLLRCGGRKELKNEL